MKKNAALVFLITFMITACKKEKAEPVKPAFDSVSAEQSANEDLKVNKGCYMAVSDEDTTYLRLEDNLGTVIGKMKSSGKDKISADLTGLSAGDTLKLTLMPDNGAQKEIWFLKNDGGLQEATGKYDAAGEYYDDYSKVTFGDGKNYKNADCETVSNILK